MSYLEHTHSRRPNHRGIVAAIAIHAAAFGFYWLSPPIMVPDILPKILTATHIPSPQPVPPPPVTSKPAPQTPFIQSQPQLPLTPPRRYVTEPIVPDLSRNSDSDGAFPPFGSGGNGSAGEGAIDPPVTPPAPDPVLTTPQLSQRFSRQFQPAYPAGLLRREIAGNVRVRVLVGSDGRAKDIQLISASEPEFWDRTRSHGLKNWRFDPATRDGEPVDAWIELTVQFQITN